MLLAPTKMGDERQTGHSGQSAFGFPFWKSDLLSQSKEFDVAEPAGAAAVETTKATTLIIYSGPRSLEDPYDDASVRQWSNFRYFFRNSNDMDGNVVSCHQDLIVVVGESVVSEAKGLVENLTYRKNDDCGTVLRIRDVIAGPHHHCLDASSIEIAQNHVKSLHRYKYVLYVSDEVAGPKQGPRVPSTAPKIHWTDTFTSRLTNSIHMVGLSIDQTLSTDPLKPNIRPIRVETSLFAIDTVGLKVLEDSKALFHCQNSFGSLSHRPQNYGAALAAAIMNAGHEIDSIVQNIRVPGGDTDDETIDNIWVRHQMMHYYGRILSFQEVTFFKTTWFVPFSVAQEVGYTGSLQYGYGDSAGLVEMARRGAGETVMNVPRIGQRSPAVSVVVLYCRDDIRWVDDYLRADDSQKNHDSGTVHVSDMTVLSYCGQKPDWLPPKAKLEEPFGDGNVNEGMAWWIQQQQEEQQQQRHQQSTTRNDEEVNVWMEDHIVLFLRDDPSSSSSSSLWALKDMVRIASSTGFSCQRKPVCHSHCQPKHYATIYHYEPLWRNVSIHNSYESSSYLDKTSDTLGGLVQALNANIPSNAIPVCLGGTFAVQMTRLLTAQDPAVWQRFQQLFVRTKANQEQQKQQQALSILTDRIWSALLSPSLSEGFGSNVLHTPRSWIETQPLPDHQLDMPGMIHFRSCRGFSRSCGGDEQDKSFLE